jgi:hypothetical protein
MCWSVVDRQLPERAALAEGGTVKLDKQTIEATLHSNQVAMLACIRHGNADRAASFAKVVWHFAILLDDRMRELAAKGLVRVGWPGLEEYLAPDRRQNETRNENQM